MQKGTEEKGEEEGTGGVAAVGPRSLPALPIALALWLLATIFLIIIIFTYVMVSHR